MARERTPSSMTSYEMFDRRMKCYRAVRDFLGGIMREGAVSIETLQQFVRGTDEAVFLFNKEFADYLKEIYGKAVELHYVTNRLGRGDLPIGDEREGFAKQEMGLLNFLSGQFQPLKDRVHGFTSMTEEDSVAGVVPTRTASQEDEGHPASPPANLPDDERHEPPASDGPESCRLFYSYSHKDEALRDELEKHLSLLRREGMIEQWHDRRIAAGQEWEGEIDENLAAAHVVLLLVSADFIASDYCFDIEMKTAMQRHEAEEAIVIPVILRPCDWHTAPFGKLLALPKYGKAATSWSNQDEAFTDVAGGIREAIGRLRQDSADE